MTHPYSMFLFRGFSIFKGAEVEAPRIIPPNQTPNHPIPTLFLSYSHRAGCWLGAAVAGWLLAGMGRLLGAAAWVLAGWIYDDI